MIRNDTEYQEAQGRLAQERDRLAQHRARLKAAGGRLALGSLDVPGFAVGAAMDFTSMMPMAGRP